MTLEEIRDSNEPWAAKKAELALEIKQQYEAGNLSQDEAKELLEDLVRTDDLDSQATDIETKAKLISAVNLLMKFV